MVRQILAMEPRVGVRWLAVSSTSQTVKAENQMDRRLHAVRAEGSECPHSMANLDTDTELLEQLRELLREQHLCVMSVLHIDMMSRSCGPTILTLSVLQRCHCSSPSVGTCRYLKSSCWACHFLVECFKSRGSLFLSALDLQI